MTELFGKIKRFKFITAKYCAKCSGKVTDNYCPKCGTLGKRDLRRGFGAFLLLDVFGNDILCAGDESFLEPMLNRVEVSIRRDVRDRLKGLRFSVWYEMWLQIKRHVEKAVHDYYILPQRIIGVSGAMKEKFFYIRKLSKTYDRFSYETKKYVEGSQSELLSIARNVFSDYDETVELWGDVPVLYYSKNVENERIIVGIRAPVGPYGKAYRVWMRINDVHMYPASPIHVGGVLHKKEWVYRVYHTKSWKENLEKILKHLVSLEEQSVKVVQAIRKIDVQQAKDILPEELLTEEREDILRMWQGGSLWDLVETASKVNRGGGVSILKKFGFLKEL